MTKVVVDTSGPVPSVVVDGVAWQPPPVVVPPAPLNSVDRTVYCMTAPHEAQPHGVDPAEYSWARGPEVQSPMPGLNKAAMMWGQAYLAAGKTLPTNTRVQFRKLRLYALTGGKWVTLQSTDLVEGDGYAENFAANASVPLPIRLAPTTGYASVQLVADHNFHYWPHLWPRPLLPAGVNGMLTSVEACLIPNDPAKPMDGSGKIVGNVGCDWYADATASVAAGGTQPGVGSGRFIVLTGAWQALNFCTVPEATLRANPPPYT